MPGIYDAVCARRRKSVALCAFMPTVHELLAEYERIVAQETHQAVIDRDMAAGRAAAAQREQVPQVTGDVFAGARAKLAGSVARGLKRGAA